MIYHTQEEILDYCEMDPFEHRTGWGHRDDKGPVPWLHLGSGRELGWDPTPLVLIYT